MIALPLMLAIAPGVSRADDSAAAARLYQALLARQPTNIPRGFSSAALSALTLNNDDKSAGMIGGVLVTMQGGESKGNYRFAIFHDPVQAQQFSMSLDQRFGASGAQRGFLPYLPNADCISQGDTQVCDQVSDNVVVLATASGIRTANTHEHQVIGGVAAGTLLGAALTHLGAVRNSIGESAAAAPPGTSAPPQADANAASGPDPCAVLTKMDAMGALRSSVTGPRRSPGTCFYGSPIRAGNGVTIELEDGGRDKFEFTRGRMIAGKPLPGVGDDAFYFLSQAGFVQIYFVKSGHYAVITLQNSGDPDMVYTAKNLAIQVANRMAPAHAQGQAIDVQ
ncbi:MAG TPA: hypothetical protein VIX59_08815 [Candidatus Binataceae bacterium]